MKGCFMVIKIPKKNPRTIERETESKDSFTVTQSPRSSRKRLLPSNKTLSPKSGIAQPPFQVRCKQGNGQEDEQIGYHQEEERLICLVVETN